MAVHPRILRRQLGELVLLYLLLIGGQYLGQTVGKADVVIPGDFAQGFLVNCKTEKRSD